MKTVNVIAREQVRRQLTVEELEDLPISMENALFTDFCNICGCTFKTRLDDAYPICAECKELISFE